MMNKLLSFKKMHEQNRMLFLPNAWDAMSALVLEQAGFEAIGTTSWGIANSLGYTDGENISYSDLFTVVERILSVINIPLTVDIESGYSSSEDKVVDNVMQLATVGAVGINIEDSLKKEIGLKNIKKHCELLSIIRQELDSAGYKDFFINARTDTYLLLDSPLRETIERANNYTDNGVNGIFVPGLFETSEVTQLVNSTDMPLNVLSLPSLTDVSVLHDLGVKRFSLGNALSDAMIGFVEEKSRELIEQRSTKGLYKNTQNKMVFTPGVCEV